MKTEQIDRVKELLEDEVIKEMEEGFINGAIKKGFTEQDAKTVFRAVLETINSKMSNLRLLPGFPKLSELSGEDWEAVVNAVKINDKDLDKIVERYLL